MDISKGMIIRIRNHFYLWTGLIFMVLNKIRRTIIPYNSAHPFSIAKYDKCMNYDFNVVHNWLSALNNLTNSSFSITGKNVLELGPGADLGVGLILLAKGAIKYNALDVFQLARKTPKKFYDLLFEQIIQKYPRSERQPLMLSIT